ncbi:IS5/IS1182 family transposase, partial [Streptococcus dysgalactiae]|nr:IS5/IS1182 family transposase [Streptococcus dysgalactiae]
MVYKKVISLTDDFDFIYDLVEDTYSSDNGRPSLDPVMLVKIPLIQCFYGIRSM